MKHTRKRTARGISFLLTLALLAGALACLPLTASAEGGGFVYTVYEGEAIILQAYGLSGEVVIPSVLDGAPVTTIWDFAFYNCKGMTGLVIPETVRAFREEDSTFGVFFGCDALVRFTVSERNPSYYAEGDCLIEKATGRLIRGGNLPEPMIPKGVKVIGDWAFDGCDRLTRVTLPEGVTAIGDGAFSNCDNLKSVTVPNSVKSIGTSAFVWCRALENVTIPNGVTHIGNTAFACSGLTEVTLPKGIQAMGKGVFSTCRNLSAVYCNAASQPTGWSADWMADCPAVVLWGHNGSFSGLLGDLGGNGGIDATDYLFLKRFCLGTLALTDAQKAVSDINGDGKINSLDYLLIKRHVLGTYKIG
ncbi:MAG: leucine-rich repeat protein [Oscillospiraceae bacterium]|nr:leucine-rich repeat protein [Oscillospiraceae bacterium]